MITSTARAACGWGRSRSCWFDGIVSAALCAVLLSPVIALAGDVQLSWTAPTQNTDSSPLTDLAGFRIYQSSEQGGPYLQVVDIPDPSIEETTLADLPAGTYYFVATAYNASGIESAFSNETSKTVTDSTTPNPPGSLTVVDSALTAFAISQSKDRLVMFPVGSVASGTTCDGTQSANGLYLVPVDSVSFVASVVQPVERPVFAACAPLL